MVGLSSRLRIFSSSIFQLVQVATVIEQTSWVSWNGRVPSTQEHHCSYPHPPYKVSSFTICDFKNFEPNETFQPHQIRYPTFRKNARGFCTIFPKIQNLRNFSIGLYGRHDFYSDTRVQLLFFNNGEGKRCEQSSENKGLTKESKTNILN